MKIVLDTNVLVSALLNPAGKPAQILNLVLHKKLVLVMDNRIFTEYINVLKREKFDFDVELIEPFLDFVKSENEFVLAEPVQMKFNDNDDKKFFEVFKTSEAQYIVTGNLKHFPNSNFIVNPSEFIDRYLKSSS